MKRTPGSPRYAKAPQRGPNALPKAPDAAAASPPSRGNDGEAIAATLLVAISRTGTRRPPEGKLGVPKVGRGHCARARLHLRSEEHTSELQSLMRISYAVFCLKKKKQTPKRQNKDTLIRNHY